ncbi:hypothetical protein AB832_07485 [Flavobacteriaceae bacterium (ex Bugula neritina AB1)]|nr:hypothetical protein AB832_07485 [Flavobacteriaceae bacterium (ex Bugula neritina AB1)]
MEIKPKKIGRPTKYREEYDEKAYSLCVDGHTNQSLAAAFGVSHSTFQDWMKNHESFRSAISAGKAEADLHVSKAVYDRACGSNGCEFDYRCANFWLRNRNPKEFSDKPSPTFDFNPQKALKEQALEIYKQASEGKLTIDDASKLITALVSSIKIEEITEIKDILEKHSGK